MKRIQVISLVLIVSVISLTGCMDVKDMSEDKADMVAEYAAGVLLRYSDQYEHRLITKEQRSREEQPQPTASAKASATPEVTATPESGMPSASQTGDQKASEETQEPVPEVSLDELYQLKGIQVAYDSCQFTKRYGNSQIRAEKGQTLFVVTFALMNTSGSSRKVNLMDRGNIRYTLDVDGSQYEPGISMLPNGGMNNLETTIKKKKTEKAVLIFRMDQKQASASSITLSVEEGDKRAGLKLR